MSHISDSKPSTYEEVIEQQVWKDAMVGEYFIIIWKDAMVEEYFIIMKNDVWE